MNRSIREATAFVASLVIAGCSQSPSSPTSAPRAVTTTSVGDKGLVGASAAGDTKVGSGTLDLVRLRMDRQDSAGNSIFRQYAQPGGTYNIRKGETIELWAEYEGASNPRFIVDFGDGFVDFINCGSCLIKHTYNREGTFVVSAKLDDRVSTTVTRSFTLRTVSDASGTFTFCNSGGITINDFAPATPFPSTINVSNVGGVISGVKASISGFSHTCPSDVAMFLLSPSGQGLMLWDYDGNCADVTGTNVTFQDGGDDRTSGTGAVNVVYRAAGDVNLAFSGPFGSDFTTFNGGAPSGAWRLYVRDMVGEDVGVISGGWCVAITTN